MTVKEIMGNLKTKYTVIELVLIILYGAIILVQINTGHDTLCKFINVVIYLGFIGVWYRSRKKSKEISHVLIYVFSFLAAIDSYLNNALMGLVFVGTIATFLLWFGKEKEMSNSGLKAFFWFAMGGELASILSLLNPGIIDTMGFQKQYWYWVDIMLVISMLMVEFQIGEKVIASRKATLVVRAIIIGINVIITVSFMVGGLYRARDFFVSPSSLRDGKAVVCFVAKDPECVLMECSDGIRVGEIDNLAEQKLSFEKSTEPGLWKIRTNSEKVFGISHDIIEGENVIVSEEPSGSYWQIWKLEEIASGVIAFVTQDNNYVMYAGEDGLLRAKKMEEVDNDCYFFLRSTKLMKSNMISWIANNNSLKVIMVYLMLSVSNVVACAFYMVSLHRKSSVLE